MPAAEQPVVAAAADGTAHHVNATSPHSAARVTAVPAQATLIP